MFVTDYSSFVSKENERLLERVKKQFTEHSMIVALTKSDLSEAQNEQEKSEVKEEFNLQDDQVILTGTFSDESKNEKWRDELKNAINKYNADGNSEVVFEMLGDIKNEMKDSISEMEEKIDQKKLEQKLEKFGVDSEIEILSKKIGKIKRTWLKNLKKHLDNAESKSIKEYEKKKIEDETGDEKFFVDLQKKAKRLLNHITGDGIKNVLERKMLIESCLQANNLPYSTKAIALSFFDDADSGSELSKYLLEDFSNNEKKKKTYGKHFCAFERFRQS